MKISEQKQGAVVVVKPEGAIALPESDALRAHLMQMLNSSMGRIVIDMSEVPFVDSSGLEVLLDVTDGMGESGQTLKLAATTKTVREVLELTDLAPIFEHYDEVMDAVRSFL